MSGTKEVNSNLDVGGNIKLSTVPNNTGTLLTYNTSTKLISTRTNTEILSDLGLTSVVSNSHTHTNKTVLDGITTTNVTNWNAAYDWGKGLRVDGNGIEVHNLQTIDTNDIKNASVWASGVNRPNNTNSAVVSFNPYVSGRSNYGLQIAGRENNFSFRTLNDNVYTEWRNIFHTGNFNPSSYVLQTSLTTQLGNYLPLAGGTITGTISTQISATTPLLSKSVTTSSGLALARLTALGYDKGFGINLSGELAFGEWSDVNTSLSGSWNKIWHSGNLNPSNYALLTQTGLPANLNTINKTNLVAAINEVNSNSVSTETQTNTIGTINWYRVARSKNSDGRLGDGFIIIIQRSYNNATNESYTFSINLNYGNATITQLSGKANLRLIQKIRVVNFTSTQNSFVEIYYNSNTINNLRVNVIGNGIALPIEVAPAPTTAVVELETVDGISVLDHGNSSQWNTAYNWGRGLRVDGNGEAVNNQSTGNANDIFNAVYYLNSGGTNGADDQNGTIINFTPYKSGTRFYGFDIMKTTASDRLWFRGIDNSVYGSWRELWHSGNFNPSNYATVSQLNNYLPLSGGTVNGATTINAFANSAWPNNTVSDANNHINKSIFKLTTNNNALTFFGDGTSNARRFGIQSGHSATNYASTHGILELNPFGGVVKIGVGGLSVDSNITTTSYGNASQWKQAYDSIGLPLTNLNTTNKTNLVAAINEVKLQSTSPNDTYNIDLKLNTTNDYDKWVMPLFEYSGNATSSLNNWVNLTITTNRPNGTGWTHGSVRVVGGDNHGGSIPRVYVESNYGNLVVIEPVLFVYGGKKYFGLRSANPAQNFIFIIKGVANSLILKNLTNVIKYQETSANTVVNAEINDSITPYVSESSKTIWGQLNARNIINTLEHGDSSQWKQAFERGDFRDFGLGLSTPQIYISNADIHNPTSFGATTSSFVGSPFVGVSAANQGYLNTLSWGDDNLYKFQEHIPVNSNIARRYRIKNNGAWGAWRTVWDSNNLTNVSQLTNDVGYLTLSGLPNPSLITSTSATGTSNIATTNTNTYLNIVFNGGSIGSSSQITGAGSVTVASDTAGKITITGTNTTYTGTNGINVTGTVISPTYGTTANTIAQGNHNHTFLTGWSDTRTVDTVPNDYNSKFEAKGIKQNGVLGLNVTTYGSYTSVIGYRGWSEMSGGQAFELGFAGNGQLLYRSGASTSWGVWNEIIHTSNLDSKTSALGYIKSGSIPAQVNLIQGAGIGITGTYPNLTITNTAPNINQTLSQSGQVVTLSNGGGSFTLPTNTNTTYTAGTGLSLTGTVFGQTITTSGTGTFVTGVTQTTNGFQINLGTPPNTTYSGGTLVQLQALQPVSTNMLYSPLILNQWFDGKSVFGLSTGGGIKTNTWTSSALSPYSIALGHITSVGGLGAVALGYGVTTMGSGSINNGYQSTINGNFSSNVGSFNGINASKSTNIGVGLLNDQEGCTVVGRFNAPTGSYDYENDTLNTSKKIFIVGGGKDADARKNILETTADYKTKVANNIYYDPLVRNSMIFSQTTLIDKKYFDDNIPSGGGGSSNIQDYSTNLLVDDYNGEVMNKVNVASSTAFLDNYLRIVNFSPTSTSATELDINNLLGLIGVMSPAMSDTVLIKGNIMLPSNLISGTRYENENHICLVTNGNNIIISSYTGSSFRTLINTARNLNNVSVMYMKLGTILADWNSRDYYFHFNPQIL